MATRPMSVRMPRALAVRLEAGAVAAGLSCSEYIAKTLDDRTIACRPKLAVLGAVIQIATIVEANGTCDRILLAELQRLVDVMIATVVADMP